MDYTRGLAPMRLPGSPQSTRSFSIRGDSPGGSPAGRGLGGGGSAGYAASLSEVRAADPLASLAANEAELLRGNGEWMNVQGPVRFAMSLLYQTCTEHATSQWLLDKRLVEQEAAAQQLSARVAELERLLASQTETAEARAQSQANRIEELKTEMKRLEERTMQGLDEKMEESERRGNQEWTRRTEDALARCRNDLTKQFSEQNQAFQKQADVASAREKELREQLNAQTQRLAELETTLSTLGSTVEEDSGKLEQTIMNLVMETGVSKVDFKAQMAEVFRTVQSVRGKADMDVVRELLDLKVDNADLATVVWENQGALLEAAKAESQRRLDQSITQLLRELMYGLDASVVAAEGRLRDNMHEMLRSTDVSIDQKVSDEARQRIRDDDAHHQVLQSSLSNFQREIEERISSMSINITASAVQKAKSQPSYATPTKSDPRARLYDLAPSNSDPSNMVTRDIQLYEGRSLQESTREVITTKAASTNASPQKSNVNQEDHRRNPITASRDAAGTAPDQPVSRKEAEYKSAAAILRNLPYKEVYGVGTSAHASLERSFHQALPASSHPPIAMYPFPATSTMRSAAGVNGHPPSAAMYAALRQGAASTPQPPLLGPNTNPVPGPLQAIHTRLRTSPPKNKGGSASYPSWSSHWQHVAQQHELNSHARIAAPVPLSGGGLASTEFFQRIHAAQRPGGSPPASK